MGLYKNMYYMGKSHDMQILPPLVALVMLQLRSYTADYQVIYDDNCIILSLLKSNVMYHRMTHTKIMLSLAKLKRS